MSDSIRRLRAPKQLTRIRVTGSGGRYQVQNGDEAPVVVLVRHDGAVCECARPACEHLDSLLMCGFIGSVEEARQAA